MAKRSHHVDLHSHGSIGVEVTYNVNELSPRDEAFVGEFFALLAGYEERPAPPDRRPRDQEPAATRPTT